jgi:hypothetical protein
MNSTSIKSKSSCGSEHTINKVKRKAIDRANVHGTCNLKRINIPILIYIVSMSKAEDIWFTEDISAAYELCLSPSVCFKECREQWTLIFTLLGTGKSKSRSRRPDENDSEEVAYGSGFQEYPTC